FFESKIRPVLADYCYQCHSSEEKVKGGLTLNTRAGLLHGGDSGEAIVPGDAEASLLFTAIEWSDRDLEMPPKQKLPADKIADFREWIEMGAPDPRVSEKIVIGSEIDVEKGKNFWSFHKPEKQAAPEVGDPSWPTSEIDQFVLEKLEAADLSPAPDARADQLLRRLYFDLIGLPPTPDQIAAYGRAWRKDPVAAYRSTVDELLASKQYGERWGRHWLDVARYAESSGKEVNLPFPHAWRYRDYVIDSFNADKPYDRFILEQVAGDLLKIKSDEEWQQNLIATGFLAVGTKGLNERDPRQFTLDLADEQIDTTTQAILGLTASCARCHDHKTDPIPMTDYYALSGIFQSTKTYFGTIGVIINRRGTKLLELPVPDKKPLATLSQADLEQIRSRIASIEQELLDARQQGRRNMAGGQATNQQMLIRLRSGLAQLRARLNGFDEDGAAKTLAMGVQDHDVPVEPTVLLRGEIDMPAQKVSRGFLQVLEHAETPPVIPAKSSGRLEFAQSLASAENPLTARVMVNRVWGHLFGRGIVPSENNFGSTGQAPTHPELLDHLALEFIDSGWSIKSLIRSIVTSRSYQMGTQFDPGAFEKDPDNRLLWRMTPRRLDAEALRDAMLSASGDLDRRRPLGSVVTDGGRLTAGRFNSPDDYRSVYLPIVRGAMPESLALFDAADPSRVIGGRDETNVPGQALYLMNNPFVIAQAEELAGRLGREAKTPAEQIARAFLICYGRMVGSAEKEASLAFLNRFEMAAGGSSGERKAKRHLALTSFCQSLFASAEFRYLN
ncbi:MAG: PSD1 and planctomycete cytochrome C domain-containing protein, partial [Verrucomicrobiales bacterium]